MTVPALSEWRTACSVERRGAFLTTGNARKKGEIRAMRKNKMMRAASGLLVAVLLSTCAISGTFAKYTTSVSSSDKARVATWGFTQTSIDLTNLFKTAYDKNVLGTADVIAPGTTNSATFTFNYDGQEAAPEVAYTFTVDTAGSTIADDIKNNPNIVWSLDDGAEGTWDTLLANIKSLSGDASGTMEYRPGQLPAGFTAADDVHTITWKWKFETEGTGKVAQDVTDTAMGNKAKLDEVTLKITVTATQID